MKGGPALAKWTIIYFVGTTFVAIFHSALLTGLVWSKLMTVADEDSLAVDGLSTQSETLAETGEKAAVHEVVVQMFESFIPQNVVYALANDSLLAIVITSIVVGYLLKPGSHILRAVQEVETLIVIIITFLIKLAPIGVFFLILPNLFRLNIADIGFNLAILIAGALAMMALHVFVILPCIYLFVVRKNPWAYWFKNSRAWITAWEPRRQLQPFQSRSSVVSSEDFQTPSSSSLYLLVASSTWMELRSTSPFVSSSWLLRKVSP